MRCMLFTIAMFLVIGMHVGCGKAADSRRVAQADPPAAAKPGEPENAPVERKIIYDSQIELEVEDLTIATQKLQQLIGEVQAKGGFLAHQELSSASSAHRRGSWTIRVPLAHFDNLVSEIERFGTLERSSRQAQDVTDAYADLEARLRNKQSSEQRLLTHLSQSAQLKDTLELERELSRVRGEVEQPQGQLNLLKSKTDLATVTLTMYERRGYTPAVQPPFVTLLATTFQGSMQNLLHFGQTLLLLFVAVAPWFFVTLIPLFLIGMIRRNLRNPVRGNPAH